MGQRFEFFTPDIPRQPTRGHDRLQTERPFKERRVNQEQELHDKAERCMDCGIPFCHSGCPTQNQIPDWNELVYQGDWDKALDALHATTNFPEFTGRVCPAPCEAACVLELQAQPVAIHNIETAIIDRGWRENRIHPQPAPHATGHNIAVIGSGPAGLSCAQQLARAGHHVVVFEKNQKPGGLLRYGIPDFRLSKRHIDRRIQQMIAESVIFKTATHVIDAEALTQHFDAVVLSCGSEQPRHLEAINTDLKGVHYAMTYLSHHNRVHSGEWPCKPIITARDKHVVVIGGGQTGVDCVCTANREKAASVTQIDHNPNPADHPQDRLVVWPQQRSRFYIDPAHALEAECHHLWEAQTQRLHGVDGHVHKLEYARVEIERHTDGSRTITEAPGQRSTIRADLVLLAMGFEHPVHEGLIEDLSLDLDDHGNVAAAFQSFATSQPNVFACGDMRRGQSLVVWAIREGRECARAVDQHLVRETHHPH